MAQRSTVGQINPNIDFHKNLRKPQGCNWKGTLRWVQEQWNCFYVPVFCVPPTKTNIYTVSYLTFPCPDFIAFGASSGAMNPRRKRPPSPRTTSWQGSAAGMLGGIGQERRLTYKTRYRSSSKKIWFCAISGISFSFDIFWWIMAMIHVWIIPGLYRNYDPHQSTWIHMWWCFLIFVPHCLQSVMKTPPFQVVAIMLLLTQVKRRL